jgi:DDE superfamily endonuclease/Helix-turn-helix of DDE superfamily endonuclease
MTYPGTVRLSRAHLAHLASLLTVHRKAIGCRWRRLSPGRQALLVLAHLRNGDTYARLAAGFGIGVATVFRYISEAVDLLAAHAPTLTAALWQLAWSDRPLAILDGTLIPIDRLGGDNNRLYYSGKHHKHGVNLQALINAAGDLLWISGGLPGSVHDLKAARTHGIIKATAMAEIQTLGDKGYQGAGGSIATPFKGRNLTDGQRHVNSLINRRRGPGERGFATLKAWKIFTKVRCCPHRIGPMAQAVLALEHTQR